jgi:hypothetical protein
MNPTLDRLGRRIGRIGDGDIHPECVANYVDLYPDRKGYADMTYGYGSPYSQGDSLGYRFSQDIANSHP